MNILIIGSGGREYSIAKAIKKEDNSHNIYFNPGNGATETLGENIAQTSYDDLALWAKTNNIGLTIVGPEQPLSEGIVDIFEKQNLTIFGPSKKAAQLEGSKAFMKNFLKRHEIPTAKYIETTNKTDAYEFIDIVSTNKIVVKADGLCAGKGVIITNSKKEAKQTVEDMLLGNSFGKAGNKVVVEEFLDGFELSVFVICDEKDYVILPACQDHKAVGDGDTGPNTGGMGAYCPTPLATDEIYKKIETNIIKPTIKGAVKDGLPFSGVLFIGVMVVDDEPIVLEYNVRFGDPECETILPLFSSSVFELFYKTATKQLSDYKLKMKNLHCVSVVMASKNYPYKKDKPVEIIIDDIHDDEIKQNSHISYAGVTKIEDKLFATGGRVLLCIGQGKTINQARDMAYRLCGQVHFSGKKLRTDIAYQAIKDSR